MSALGQKWLCQLATLGPLGHVRPAPGTIGSLVALGSGYLIASISLGALIKESKESRFQTMGEPFPMGIGLSRYYGCFWERV